MKRSLVVLVKRSAAILLLASLLAGCGSTPEPTEVPATQTPWIVVLTATPGSETVVQAQPTQTPWIIVATATQEKRATGQARTSTPTAGATEVSPEATLEPSPTAMTPTPVTTKTPTNTPAPEEIKYRAPELLDPPPEGRVGWKSRLLLKWSSVAELAQDEFYKVEFDRPPVTEAMLPYGDYVFVKDSEYLWEGSALAPFHPPEVQGEAVVYWWVRVVRKTGEDENGKPVGVDISPPSDKWTLVLEPKPEGE
jgi:hypothetical protein